MWRGTLTALCLLGSAVQAAPRVEATPSRVVLGRDGQVQIRVEPERDVGVLRWSVSSGQLAPEPAGNDAGARTFRWTPPAIRHPSRAILVFWQDDGLSEPEPVVLEIPLLGRTDLEMDTEPGAWVEVRIQDARYGPVRANPRGRVRVPVEVPPGVRQAQVNAQVAGQRTTRTVPLEVPRTRPVAAAISADAVSPDGGYLIVAHPEDLGPGALSVRSRQARLEEVETYRRASIYRVLPHPGATEVVVSLRVGPHGAGSVRKRVGTPTRTAARTANAPGRFSLQGQVGFFAAGGANLGPSLELGAAVRLPGMGDRLFAELGGGFRMSGLSRTDTAVGSVDSNLQAFPLFAGLRGRVLDEGHWAVDARAGVSAIPFRHTVEGRLQPAASEGGIGFGGYLGAQGIYRLSTVELLLDLRGEWNRVSTPRFEAWPGGFVLGLGARWSLP